MGASPSRVTIFVRRHRRGIAFLAGFGGAILLISAVNEEPELWPALVTSAALPAGHVLAPADLQVVQQSSAARPATAVASPDDAVGRTLAGPMAAGEMVLSNRLVGPGLLFGAPSGQVAIPIRLTEPAEAAFLRPGDVVDVLAASRGASVDGAPASDAQVVARGVRVLAAPGTGTADQSGLLGAPSTTSSGPTPLIVAVPSAQAAIIAGAAAGSELSVALREGGAPSAPAGGD